MSSRHRLAVVVAFACQACGIVGFESVDPGDGGTLMDRPPIDGAQPDTGVAAPGTLARVCAYQRVTVILDGDATDARAGQMLADAIASGCGSTLTVRTLPQEEPGLLDPSTYAPMLGPDDLGAVGGDSYYQKVMAYLSTSLSPLYTIDDGTRFQMIPRATGVAIVDVMASTISATHDYAAIQIIEDPATSSTVVATHGYLFGGTLAGAYYFATALAPTLASDTRGFYVVEWTNGDADPEPSAGDTFTVLGSGT